MLGAVPSLVCVPTQAFVPGVAVAWFPAGGPVPWLLSVTFVGVISPLGPSTSSTPVAPTWLSSSRTVTVP